MRTQKIYLSGPMRGRPYSGYGEFYRIEGILEHQGYTVFNPARMDVVENETQTSPCVLALRPEVVREWLRRDLRLLVDDEADWICMLPGWENSGGALVEKAVAEALGIPVVYWCDVQSHGVGWFVKDPRLVGRDVQGLGINRFPESYRGSGAMA